MEANYDKKEQGFIAVLVVLIILGIILSVSLGISQLSVLEAQMAFQKSQSSQAYYLANLCAEESLVRLKETNGTYTDETKPVENGTCKISAEAIGGNWVVEISADFQNQTRKIKIVITQINPQIIINSWQEVAGF